MTSWNVILNISVDAAGITVAVLGLVMALMIDAIDHYSHRFFMLFFTVLLCYVWSNLLDSVFIDYLRLPYTAFFKANLFAESLLSSVLLVMIVLFFLHCTGEDARESTLFRVTLALWLLYLLLLIITQFTSFIYTFTAEGRYRRGALYPLLLVPPGLSLAVGFLALVRRHAVLSRRQRLAFGIYYLVPMAFTLIQILVPKVRGIVFGTALSSLLLFVFVLADQVEHTIRQSEENARQRASILVLQMRPHFVYNTLMSIYYLCRQNAEKAQQVILDFTTYLRMNFTAIAKEGTVPFTEELRHAQAYLAVEQARFADKLYVELDTPHTAFRLPPLTLQPIVENAVKHGVDPELGPLSITVRTRRTADGSELSVEDTGPGFAPKDDDEPHIALANIRERLAHTCRATMTFTRRDERTVVTILVPDAK